MGRRKGAAKTGGRKSGVPNKSTQGLLLKVDEICQKVGVNPFEILANLAKDPDKLIALQASKELCQYLAPKRRAVEISEDPKNPIGASSEAETIANQREQIRIMRNERGWK